MHTLASKRLVTSLHFFIVKKRLLHSFRYLDLWPIVQPSLTSVTAVRNDFLSWWRKAVLETLSDILLWSLRELDSVSPALLTGRGQGGRRPRPGVPNPLGSASSWGFYAVTVSCSRVCLKDTSRQVVSDRQLVFNELSEPLERLCGELAGGAGLGWVLFSLCFDEQKFFNAME